MTEQPLVCPQCGEPWATGDSARECPKCRRPYLASSDGPTGANPSKRRRSVLVVLVAVTVLAAVAAWRPLFMQWLRPTEVNLPEGFQGGNDSDRPGSVSNAEEDTGPAEPIYDKLQMVLIGDATVLALSTPVEGANSLRVGLEINGMLGRELVRQAVLIAARDGLGLTVRDVLVGDPLPTGKPAGELDIVWRFAMDYPPLFLKLKRGGESPKTLLNKELAPGSRVLKLPELIEAMEAMSRSELPEALKAGGLTDRRPKAKQTPGAELPDAIADRLDSMSFAEQFTAVRLAHAAIRDGGPSPEAYAVLVRGYANLGLLTEHEWDAAHKAYFARALLYAQRMVAEAPKTPRSLWHRAYAEALAGLHRTALADLAAAQAFEPAGGTGRPVWADLIDAYCRYKTDKLAVAVDAPGPQRGLAALLRMLTVEFPPRTNVSLVAAREALNLSPENFRAVDTLCESGSLSSLHLATTLAPKVLESLVPKSVLTIPGLPETVRATIAAQGGEVKLTRSLDESADPARDPVDPSWGVMAREIREARFLAVWRRLWFMRDAWSVPTSEYWAEAQPLVAGHRYEPFLAAYVTGASDPRSGFSLLAESLDKTNLTLNVTPLTRMLRLELKPPNQGLAFNAAVTHADPSARNLSQFALDNEGRTDGGDDGEVARRLLEVSPHNPYAMGLLVGRDRDTAEKFTADWEKDAGDHPALTGPLAKHYSTLGRDADAERLLKKYIERSPDLWAIEALAETRKNKGDLAGWKSILDDYLERSEDTGLDHAKVRVKIAMTILPRMVPPTARQTA